VTTRQLAGFIWRWAWLWLLGMLIAGAASYRVSSQLPRVYQSQAKLLVGSADLTNGTGDFGAVQSASQLTATYSQVITTSPIIETALAAGDVDLSPGVAAGLVTAAPVAGTQLIQITVHAGDPDFAATFANLLAAAFMQRIQASQTDRYAAVESSLANQVDQLGATQDDLTHQVADLQAQPPGPTRDEQLARVQFKLTQVQTSFSDAQRSYQDVLLAKARSTNPISVVEPARPAPAAVQPQVRQNVLAAAGVGLLLMLLVAYLAEHLDDRLLSPERAQRLTGAAPLATIPRVQAGRTSRAGDAAASAFQALGASVLSALTSRPRKTIFVANTQPGDGATTVAVNLAVTLAAAGRRVILVDANVSRPALQQLFDIPAQLGLMGLLRHPDLQVVPQLSPEQLPGLRILACGANDPEAAPLLASPRMHDVLTELSELADLIVVDAPGVPGSDGTLALSSWADGVVLVVDARRTHSQSVMTAASILRGMEAHFLGIVLNKTHSVRGLLPFDARLAYSSPEPPPTERVRIDLSGTPGRL
jgi:capsular exopolysaccharide synthesis family protein